MEIRITHVRVLRAIYFIRLSGFTNSCDVLETNIRHVRRLRRK